MFNYPKYENEDLTYLKKHLNHDVEELYGDLRALVKVRTEQRLHGETVAKKVVQANITMLGRLLGRTKVDRRRVVDEAALRKEPIRLPVEGQAGSRW